jgi:hypothetical protein
MAITPLTSSFTPVCNGTISTAGVTTAATAFDWFETTGGGGTGAAAIANSSNKAFAQGICKQAKSSLVPLVKAEQYASILDTFKPALTNSINSAKNALNSIQLSVDTGTKTALASAYTAEVATITAMLNRVKTLENKVFVVGDSIDVGASAGTGNLATAYAATTTLTAFTTAPNNKVYVSTLLDPAVLGNGGTAIPSLTASTYANAGTLEGYYTTAATAITATTVPAIYKAAYLTATKQIFDTYCIMLQGFAATGTSGNYTGTAPVGIFPGIDFLIFTDGEFQTGTAASGTPGAPSATVDFW